MNLTDDRISYTIISSKRLDAMMSFLWGKQYKIIPIKGYYKGNFEESIIAYNDSIDNDSLRKDVIFLLDNFNQECAIIKYKGETGAKKIFNNGSERLLDVIMYNTDSENKSYLHNGLSFSFIEKKRYWKPKSESDFEKGMIVEYLNNNKWSKHKVNNPSIEYDRLFKLLIKYDKIRIESKY